MIPLRGFYISIMIAFVLIIYLLFQLSGILMPFVIGFVVAYFLDPVADYLENLGTPRILATAIISIGMILAILSFLIFGLPILFQQIGQLVMTLPDYIRELQMWIGQQGDLQDQQKIVRQIGESAIGTLKSVTGQIFQSGLSILNILGLLLISPIVAIYMLNDWDRMTATIDRLLPNELAETVRHLFHQIDEILSGFLRGQILVCLLLATIYVLGLSLVGLKGSIVVGIIAGLLSFMPYVGSVFGVVLAASLGVGQFGLDLSQLVPIFAVFAVGQFVEGNFLTPRLVGNRVQLHPVWIMFALLAMGSVFGFLGLLLAVPSAAVIGVLVRHALVVYQRDFQHSVDD